MSFARTTLVVLALCALPAVAQDDPAKALRSKDPLERLAAVDALAAGDNDKAPKLLAGALDDDDWEVAERAARALATVGDAKSVDALVEMALEAPCARLRRAAARAIAVLDADAGAEALAKKASSKFALPACEALRIVGPATEGVKLPKAVAKRAADEDQGARERAAAAAALVACAGSERAVVLGDVLDGFSVVAQAAALEVAAVDPPPEQHQVLLAALARPHLPGVLERRTARAVAAGIAAASADARAALVDPLLRTLGAQPEAKVAARAARLVPLLAKLEQVTPAGLVAALEPSLEHADAGVRAQAAGALRFAGDDGLARARDLAEGADHARVRRAALSAVVAIAPQAEETGVLLAARLASDSDAAARELAAVALGDEAHADHAPALAAALADEAWGVSACAAVSLGTCRGPGALEALRGLAQHDDWRRRGAALVGVFHLREGAGVPLLVEALADDEPSLARTAYGALLSYSGNADLPAEVEPWRAWWRENEGRLRLIDPKEVEERRRRYGYAVPAQEIFRGLDVCVLESRGDHIQVVLEALEIAFRLTAGARIPQDALDVAGVFVSNCTGEMEPADVERLSWFVRCGGYLFGSCWALSQTIERVAPGAVRKLETGGEVLDMVLASPCALESPYLRDVFPPDVEPIYTLEGAHLIEVLEPERVEVLIDSAECAERWGGGGELACWFAVGHGKVLDSVNHFDLQGLERAMGLKKPEQRMAYAVDHMGLGWERLRETRKERWWGKALEASRQVRDLSVFELVTNFVRLRRMEGR